MRVGMGTAHPTGETPFAPTLPDGTIAVPGEAVFGAGYGAIASTGGTTANPGAPPATDNTKWYLIGAAAVVVLLIARR